MAQEQELKLAVAQSDWPRVIDWLKTLDAALQPRQWLNNIYFDTPEGELNRRRVALRIRQSDAGYVQTLKTKGSARHGLHDRQEWDWPLALPELNTRVLADTPIGGMATLGTLRPVFTTDFERLAWLWHDGDHAIEIALDRGEVRAKGRTATLSEVELELKAGATGGLVTQAQALSRVCPVFLNPVSKAEQGYYLGGLYQPGADTRSPRDGDGDLIDAWFQALGFYGLTGQQTHLHQACSVFAQLATREAQLGPEPRPTADQFQELLTYQESLVPGTPDEARAQLLRSPLMGVVQLMLMPR